MGDPSVGSGIGDDVTGLPPAGEVRVWVAELSGPGVAADAWQVLDDDELAQAACFRAEEHRQRFARRRAVRRRVLGAYLGVPAKDLRFGATCNRCGGVDHGKPSIVGRPGIRFSASHSCGLAVVAVVVAPVADAVLDVGVDVEVMPRDASFLWTVLAEEERRHVRTDRPDRSLLAAWTRKEAFLKAIGAGLTVDPSTVPVLGCDAVVDDDGRHWELTTLPVGDAVLGVAATPGSTVRVVPLADLGPGGAYRSSVRGSVASPATPVA